MKPIEMLICSGCGEYAGSHIDAVIGGLQAALSEAIARAERAEAAVASAYKRGRDDAADWCASNTMDIPMDHSKRVYAGLYCAGENLDGKHQGMGYSKAIRAMPLPTDLTEAP